VTNEEIYAYQLEQKAFYETQGGKLLRTFESALINSTAYGEQDNASFRKLAELDERVTKAREELKNYIKSAEEHKCQTAQTPPPNNYTSSTSPEPPPTT